MRPFLEYIKSSFGKHVIPFHGLASQSRSTASSGASDAQTPSIPRERTSTGAESVMHEREATGNSPSTPTRPHDQPLEDIPEREDHQSPTTPATAPSLTNTSGGRGSHTTVAQSRSMTPSGELPVQSSSLASPPRAAVIPNVIVPGTGPTNGTLFSTNGGTPPLHGDSGLQDDQIDYSLLDGLQYDNFAEFHPEPPSFPPSILEGLLMFPHLSPMELPAYETSQQPAHVPAVGRANRLIDTAQTKPIAEAPLNAEQRTAAQPHVSASGSQRAPAATVPIQLSADLATWPPQSLPAPQVATLPSLPPQTTQASDPAPEGPITAQAPARASPMGSLPPQCTSSASLSAAIAGAYLRRSGAPLQQAANPVDFAPINEAPAVDQPGSVEEPQVVTAHAHGDPAPTSAQSDACNQEAPGPSQAELNAPSQASAPGGRARRERRPRVNPDGTIADGPGTGRYVGGGEGGMQVGLALLPSSKKRANRKQGGPRATKKKR